MSYSVDTFTDYILFFGSSSLVGKGALENLLDINFYIKNVSDIQGKLDSLTEIKGDVVLNKHVFCVNRRSIAEEKSFMKTIDYINMRSVTWKGGRYYLRSRKEKDTEKRAPSPNTFCYDAFEEGFIKNTTEEKGNDNFSFTYNQKQFSYALHYACGKEKGLGIIYNFTVTQMIIPRSENWPRLLSRIFSGTRKLEKFDTNNKTYVPGKNLPNLCDIRTMVCSLGSTSARVRKTQVPNSFADYYLPFTLAQEFTNTTDKKLVVITAFNNDFLSKTFEYFRTKAKLENDLDESLPNKLKELVILRPGPMCGQHGNPINVELGQENSNLLEKILYYPRYLLVYKKQYIGEVRRVGLRTKLSEIIASSIYRMPGSALLGYAVPVSKVSYVASLMAIERKSKEAGPKLEVISSYQIDMIA